MAHVVSGKLRKAPFIKSGCGPNGDSTMYGIELSEMVKDYRSDEKFYANYKALFFAKTQGANDFYSKAFAEGSYVSVSCEKLKVEQREHNGQNYVSLQMENPRLDGALPMVDQGGGYQQQAPQQAPAQAQQPQGQQAPQHTNPAMDFDDDIPF